MSKIKSVPTTICGVFLALIALANYWQAYIPYSRAIFGTLGSIALLLLCLKIICFPKLVIEDLKNPVICGVFATFFMGLSIFSTYFSCGKYIWYISMILHILLILWFTYRFFIKNYNIKMVFTSYFVMYVGFAINGMAAPAFDGKILGQYAFYFSFIAFIILSVLLVYRYIKYREIASPLQPLFCIFTAPSNLCLASYLQSFDKKNIGLVIGLLIIGLIIYVVVLFKLVTVMKPEFYPSYSAFTFPFVISAVATKGATGFLTKMGYQVSFLNFVYSFQAIIATVLTLYTLIRFLHFIGKKTNKL